MFNVPAVIEEWNDYVFDNFYAPPATSNLMLRMRIAASRDPEAQAILDSTPHSKGAPDYIWLWNEFVKRHGYAPSMSGSRRERRIWTGINRSLRLGNTKYIEFMENYLSEVSRPLREWDSFRLEHPDDPVPDDLLDKMIEGINNGISGFKERVMGLPSPFNEIKNRWEEYIAIHNEPPSYNTDLPHGQYLYYQMTNLARNGNYEAYCYINEKAPHLYEQLELDI